MRAEIHAWRSPETCQAEFLCSDQGIPHRVSRRRGGPQAGKDCLLGRLLGRRLGLQTLGNALGHLTETAVNVGAQLPNLLAKRRLYRGCLAANLFNLLGRVGGYRVQVVVQRSSDGLEGHEEGDG